MGGGRECSDNSIAVLKLPLAGPVCYVALWPSLGHHFEGPSCQSCLFPLCLKASGRHLRSLDWVLVFVYGSRLGRTLLLMLKAD